MLENCGSVQRCGSCDILRRIILFQVFLKKINISKTVLILCCYFDAELSYHSDDQLRPWMTGLGRPGLLWTSAMWDSSCSETKAQRSL